MKRIKSDSIAPAIILVLFSITVFGFFYVFVENWIIPLYAAIVVLLAAELFLMPFYVLGAQGKSTKKSAISGVISLVAGLALVLSLAYLLNNFLNIGNTETALIIMGIAAVFIFVPFIMWLVAKTKPSKAATGIFTVLSVVIMLTCAVRFCIPMYYKSYDKKEASPTGYSQFTEKESALVTDATFYVSPAGNDTYDGSFTAPFATLEKARDAVRTLDKTGLQGIKVAVMAGEYRVSCIEFIAADSGTERCPITYCAYGDGEVILNGGITITPDAFSNISDKDVLARLSDDAKSNVMCVNLTEHGITAEDYGSLYAIGMYNTAEKYDGDYVGELYSEVFFNGTRMTLARYPDFGEYLYTENVVSTGNGRESDGATTAVENWDEIRNPVSDVYSINEELTSRIASWETLDDVWMFGFWKYDWADASSPIGNFDAEKHTLSPKFVSTYGTKEDAPYYFYNVFEELTTPGEFYIDRANGILYIYPLAEMANAKIDMTLSTDNIIKLTDADYITFDGITVTGTRSDAISVTGNNNTVSNCLIKNIAGYAVKATGYDNLVSRNEITRTGRGGIILDGGDTKTLSAGNNIADNNLIHDWSEIYQTYNPAVVLNGTGNVCSHNEMYNSPHEAITYSGNNHVIEYNVIHDVCLITNDGGAIYSGRRWDWYGTKIMYNLIYDLGSGDFTPDGIYLDDALSGQTVYGNILVNVPKYGLHLGGGRDLDVRNNIVINTFNSGVSYDDRARDGAVNNGWFNHSSKKDGDMWSALYESPWQSDIWKAAFPQMTKFSDDFNDTDSPDFVPNPAYSTVTGNLFFNIKKSIGNISDSASTYSTIENNAIFGINALEDFFVNPNAGDYSLKANSKLYDICPDFEEIKIAEIGRY